MNNPGTTVYVHWYGKLLQGTVVNDHDLFGMVAVRIPLQGGHPVALFTPAHVYESETAANGIQAGEPHKKMADDRTATTCKDSKAVPAPAAVPGASAPGHATVPAVSPAGISTKANPSEAWEAIQKFKADHWDTVHNHLRVDALNDFYRLWCISVAARYGVTIEEPPVTVVAVDPGSPDGDHSATYIVDTETGEILSDSPSSQAEVVPQPIVSEERYQELKEKMKVKLTKKQKNSTGRIEYTDSIQTSFFD